MSSNHYDRELYEAIQELLNEEKDPEGCVGEITRQVVSQGYGSLNSKQRAAFDALVLLARKRVGKRGISSSRQVQTSSNSLAADE